MFDPVAAEMRIEAEAVIGVSALLRIAELLQASVDSVQGLARANVSSAGAVPEKGGADETTELEDRAGSDGACDRGSRKRAGAVDGTRPGGGGERRQR